MKRQIFFLYGFICYAIFFLTFLYQIGFVGNLVVPKGIDSPEPGSLGVSLLINAVLIGLFGLQHTVMARPGFKRWWTRTVPTPIERATYVLLSSALLILLFWQWRPITQTLWDVQHPLGRPVLIGLYLTGYLIVLYSSVLIDHFDLFGLRQVFLYLRKKDYTPPRFAMPTLYRIVRHPLYLGWLVSFWVTPSMTYGHILFAAGMTAYIFIAIRFEERDLVSAFGDEYERYRRRTSMILPIPKRNPQTQSAP